VNALCVCDCRSGSVYEKYVQRLSNEELYEQYKSNMGPLIAELIQKLEKEQDEHIEKELQEEEGKDEEEEEEDEEAAESDEEERKRWTAAQRVDEGTDRVLQENIAKFLRGEPIETITPRSFNTFLRVKAAINIRKAHKYFGMFECQVGSAGIVC
jgi:hypothetical protein